jgi:hypothetical protein
MKEYCGRCGISQNYTVEEEPVEIYVNDIDKIYIIGMVARCD